MGNIHTVNLNNNYGFNVHCENIFQTCRTRRLKTTKHCIHFLSNNTYYRTRVRWPQIFFSAVICCCHRSRFIIRGKISKFFAYNFLVSFWFMKLLHCNEYIIQVIFAWIFYDFWIFSGTPHFLNNFFDVVIELGYILYTGFCVNRIL